MIAYGQSGDTAAIFRAVADTQGFALSGAAVRLTNRVKAQTRLATTNSVGSYLFSLLPVGSYSLVVEQASFRRYERTGILLHNLGLPNASIGNPRFGQILTTDGDLRIMLAAVKVAF